MAIHHMSTGELIGIRLFKDNLKHTISKNSLQIELP
jgi:hypothetical protein